MAGNNYSSRGLYNETVTGQVSSSPTITNMFYDGILMDDNFTLSSGLTGTIRLEGYNFTKIDGILLSSGYAFNKENGYETFDSPSDRLV